MTSSGAADPIVLAERYRLDERIAAGSMGAVWRATDERLGRTVAVKQLLLQPGTPGFDAEGPAYEEARQRILREGRLAARLQHPHAISVFDVVLHEDVPWLVMEYLASRTLGALLVAEGPLEPRRAAAVGQRVADGLAAAHAAGIVHRDIKPGNVLIGEDGTVKITDFGVSRAADDVQLTRTGLIAGTPAFLAPEVARGQTPTTASDVFALGSTVYAAVQGEPPFGLDDNTYALLHTVGAGQVRPPTHAGPLRATLEALLDRDPARRPSAAQARDWFAAVAAGGTPLGSASSSSYVSYAAPNAGFPPHSEYSARGTRVDLSPARPGAGAGTSPAAAGSGIGSSPASGAGSGAGSGSGSSPDAPARWPVPAAGPAAPARLRFDAPARLRPDVMRGPSGRRLVFAAAVLAVLLGVAVAVAVPSGLGRQPAPSPPLAQPSPPTTAPAEPLPAESAPAESAPAESAPVEPAPAGPPSAESAPVEPAPGSSAAPRPASGEPTAAAMEQFVRDYYALLPGDTDRAWKLLGEQARDASDGLSGYQRFYRTVGSISFADGPTAVDDRTVRARLVFESTNGNTSGPEPYEFVVERGPGGGLLMSAFSRG